MKRFITLLIVVFTAFSFTRAADIIVTSFLDSGDGTFRDAVANAQSGDVIKFNIAAPVDMISFDTGISISGAGKILTIDGMNMATGKPMKLTIQSGSRLFSIANGAGSDGLDVTIKNFIIQDVQSTNSGGVISSGSSAYTAAGAFKVTIENCYFKNCTTTISSSSSSGGGGVYYVSHGSDITVINCTFEGNKLLYSDGTENATPSIGGGAFGSTGNGTARLALINSTFIDNASSGRGGALFLGHPTNIINCTFANNTAPRGGGIYLHNTGDNYHNIVNTIVINNVSKTNNTDRGDIDRNSNNGTNPVTVSYSLFELTNLTADIGLGAGNITYVASTKVFKDGTLADNGGPTPTIALASNSDVLKAGTATSAGLNIPTTDQRGAPRLSPPSMGAYDNPDYVFTGMPEVNIQALSVWGDGKQIKMYSETQGWAAVYDLKGSLVDKSYVNGLSNLATVKSAGVYLVRFVGNSGNTSSAKVVVR